MAARKKTVKKKAAKKSGKKSLMTMEQIEAAMAAEAELDAARLGTGGGTSSMISIKGGSFTYKEADLGTELDCIIVDFVNINEWYDRPYSADNDSYVPPACCAISRDDPDEMSPFRESPILMEDNCCDCDYNDFGSADNGKSKRCGNKRLLMIMVPDELGTSPDEVEIALLKVPSASIKAFDKFVKGLSKVLHRPSYGVIAQISFDDSEDYPKLEFKLKEKIGSAKNLFSVQEVRKLRGLELEEMPDFSQYEAPVAKAKKGRKKKVGRGGKLGRKG